VKIFLVDVLMTGFGLGVNSNFFEYVGEEPSPTYGSFCFVSLDDHSVFGFLGGFVPALEIKLF